MKPTEELMQEHGAIQTMLGILDSACKKLEASEPMNLDDLPKMIAFFKEFADGCHHCKEEGFLFPAMEQAGVPREQGPIGVMLSEHTLGRAFIKGMSEAAARLHAGETAATPRFVENARGYIAMLSQHILKENNILFPMADARLSAETQSQMEKDFERLERETIGAGKHQQFHILLNDLSKTYLS
jgi:hemerythrin-like domain-containing protein